MAAEVKLTPYRRLRRKIYRTVVSFPGVSRLLGVSGLHQIISRDEALASRTNGWLASLTAYRQQSAYLSLLADMQRGAPRIDLQIATQGILETGLDNPTILEVGCGNGYYSEVFDFLLNRPFLYLGTDYSTAMIDSARSRYPNRRFEIANACLMPYADSEFDIVFNGVSLMHIMEFEAAIRESARVAGSFCLYHSVPLFDERETTYFRKYAYGAPVVEVIFNRQHLMSLFQDAGLTLIKSWRSIPYDVHPATPEHSYTETFLLKVAPPTQLSSM